MIYFMQAVDGGPVKIGHSADVDTRRHQLEQLYRKPLAILATMDGGRDEELQVHRRFAHLRLGRTEQFQPALELFEFIGRPLLVDPNPDAVELMETGTWGAWSNGKPGAGRKPSERGPRSQAMGIRAYPEWLEWLSEFREFCASKGLLTTDNVSVIDLALIELAKALGFRQPPER